MATAYLRAESAPVILPHNYAQAAAVMAQFDRAAIASAIEVMVNLLDVCDGDADFEGECSEDEISRCTDLGLPIPKEGAGCEISDPSGQHDEDGINTFPVGPLDRSGPGCLISDNDFEHDGAEQDHGDGGY